jgi:NitT/TauT family transport system substrate-binding protein
MHCVDPSRPLIASRTEMVPPAHAKETPAASVASVEKSPPAPAAVETPPPAPAPAPAETPAPAPAADPSVPVVNMVYFGPGDAALSAGDRLTLGHIAEYLHESKADKIQLVAYTDPVGSAKKNAALAARRAKAVYDQLAAKGVDKDRMAILPPNLSDSKRLPPTEYWTLRKTVVLYGNDTIARVKKHEEAEDARVEKELAPADKEAKPEGPKLETIDVIYWKNVTHGLFIIAKKMGFFEKEGFNVRLRESHLEANELNMQLAEDIKMQVTRIPLSAKDVKSKRYFLGAVCPYGFHEALSEKMPFVQIGGMLANPNTFLAKKELVEAAMKNLRAFKGITIGRANDLPNGFDSNYFLLDRLIALGFKEGVDFKVKNFPTDGEAVNALARGEIDVLPSGPPDDLEFTKRHPDYAIFPMSQLNLNLPCCRQVVTRDNLKRNREKYVRFERAVIRAQRYLSEHPDESIEILAGFLKLPVSTIRSIFQRPGFALYANPNVKGTRVFADTMVQRLGKNKVGDVREAVDTSVYEEALLDLVKKEPAPAYNEMLSRYRNTR